ncbi:MAG: Translation initiation factor IF-3 [Mycoplasmataceae bacterium]|nr:MAG: Translation initiation factor IF-3 [Mycoplasmataceae bacterium]
MKFNNTNNKITLSQFLNERINFPQFLLIDENGENVGIVSKQEALSRARSVSLDLFCITPRVDNPVCKILDFPKYIYQLKKKDSGKVTNKKNTLKEAKFSFRISDNDAKVKVNKIIKWLEDDFSVKTVLFMRGREQQHKDIALEKCKKIISDVQNASPSFQLKEDVKLIGSMYNFTFFKNRKVVKDEKN